MSYIEIIILIIIEGVTEFIPVSSTGHMIIASYIMDVIKYDFTNLFIVSIQFGSILSLLTLYKNKLFVSNKYFYIKIFVGNIPILLFAFFLEKFKIFFRNPLLISISFILGGILLIIADNWYINKFSKKNKTKNQITIINSFVIGLFQCFAIIPGISRSATSIIGAIFQGINRKSSVEYSFFLALPIIGIATFKEIFNYYINIDFTRKNIFILKKYFYNNEIILILFGILGAFLISTITVRYFIKYISKNGFKIFGYYRIFIGIIILTIYIFKIFF